MRRPWIAIGWFAFWGVFQSYAVASVIRGTWQRPPAFPEEAYNALIYPDLAFIPLYFLAACLLALGKRSGRPVTLVAGGGVLYVMVYLLALARFQGVENLVWDGLFLAMNATAIAQVWRLREGAGGRHGC